MSWRRQNSSAILVNIVFTHWGPNKMAATLADSIFKFPEWEHLNFTCNFNEIFPLGSKCQCIGMLYTSIYVSLQLAKACLVA